MSVYHAVAERFKSNFDEAVKKIEAGEFARAASIIKAAADALDGWSTSAFADQLHKIEARGGVRLVETGGPDPEQYDAFIGMDKIGYLRMRGGAFTVEYLTGIDYARSVVYSANPDGNGYFFGYERSFFLNAAKAALIEAYVKDKLAV